jgi:transposase-like protein
MAKKRRRFSPEFKARVALQMMTKNKSLAEICSDNEIHPSQAKSWRKQAEEVLLQGFSGKTQSESLEEAETLNEELFKQVGMLKYEVDWLKKKHKQLGIS